MKRTIALIYKSNQARNLDRPYYKAAMIIIGPAVTLFLLICAAVNIYPFGNLASPFRVLIVGAILFLLFKLFSAVFKEAELARYEFSEIELKKASSYVKLCNAVMVIFVLIALVLIAMRSFS